MKRFTPITIETKNPQHVFEEHKRDISKRIIEAIDFGVTNKRKRVTFAKVAISGLLYINLSVDQSEYLNVIDQNIENLIEFEEYETCALGVKLKQKLSAPKKRGRKVKEKVTQ